MVHLIFEFLWLFSSPYDLVFYAFDKDSLVRPFVARWLLPESKLLVDLRLSSLVSVLVLPVSFMKPTFFAVQPSLARTLWILEHAGVSFTTSQILLHESHLAFWISLLYCVGLFLYVSLGFFKQPSNLWSQFFEDSDTPECYSLTAVLFFLDSFFDTWWYRLSVPLPVLLCLYLSPALYISVGTPWEILQIPPSLSPLDSYS